MVVEGAISSVLYLLIWTNRYNFQICTNETGVLALLVKTFFVKVKVRIYWSKLLFYFLVRCVPVIKICCSPIYFFIQGGFSYWSCMTSHILAPFYILWIEERRTANAHWLYALYKRTYLLKLHVIPNSPIALHIVNRGKKNRNRVMRRGKELCRGFSALRKAYIVYRLRL